MVKLYYRDANKVFRAVEGIDISRESKFLYVRKSVYTQTRADGYDYMFQVKQK